MTKRKKTYSSTWIQVPDPLYYIECPNPKCKQIIFMSTPSVIKRLKEWAKKLYGNSTK